MKLHHIIAAAVVTLLCSFAGLGAESGEQSDSDNGNNSYTPVENVIKKYADVKGSRDLIASGNQMTLARSLIRRTPLASVASEVDVLEVLKMQNAAEDKILDFEKDLKTALKSYEYYGQTDTKNGKVDIYLTRENKDTIDELVIYNPAIKSLNSLKGHISASQLLNIYKK